MADTVQPETVGFAPVIGRRNIISIAAYILAGGSSRRFGVNKALYLYKGQPLIEYPLNLLNRYFDSISIIAKNAEEYAQLGYPVLTDSLEQQSPLVGILTGLEDGDSEWNIFVSCDVPYLGREVPERLLTAVNGIDNEEVDAIVSVSDGIVQPMAACYNRRLVKSLRAAIPENPSVQNWLGTIQVRYLDFRDSHQFVNVNRKQDFYDVHPH